MNIEKCSITTTETRTREMWGKPLLSDEGTCLSLHSYKNETDDVLHTLTYAAPVQVEGVRVEMSREEAHVLLSILGTTTKVEGLPFYSSIKDVLGSGPFNDDAQPDHEASRARAITIAASVNKSVDAKVAESIAERGDEAEMRRRGWEWDGHAKWWAKIIGERKCMVWYDHADSTWNANKGMDHIGSYLTQTAAADNCETYTPDSTQPATLPWHDLGRGLSVAVVEGKGAYRVRLFADGWMSLFMAGDGSLSHVSDDSTLAAAKAACERHAKGGEA